jgi:hypothetical protein
VANANKDKGRRAELAVGRYLNEQGWPHAEPTRRSGWADDRGDIDGLPGVCLEVKADKHFRRDEWIAELAAEMGNARCQVGAVIVKRWGTTEVGDWYALLPVSVLVHLIRDAGYQ